MNDSDSFPHKAATDPAAAEAMRAAILGKLTYMVGKDRTHALDHDWFMATALAVRDRIFGHAA